MNRRTTLGQLYREQGVPMAHLPAPEPRWRWTIGILGEIGFVLLAVLLVVALASMQPPPVGP